MSATRARLGVGREAGATPRLRDVRRLRVMGSSQTTGKMRPDEGESRGAERRCRSNGYQRPESAPSASPPPIRPREPLERLHVI